MFLLLAPLASADPLAADSPAPVDWLYAGDAIDWASVRFDGPDVVTVPEAPCVASAAWAADWSPLGIEATSRALVVLDVPALEATCSRS